MDRAKEQIRFNTEIIKLLVVILVGTAGGSLSFLADGKTTAQENIFIGFGIVLIVVLVNFIKVLYGRTDRLIDALG